MKRKLAQVFEYQTLAVGEQGLTQPIFDRLVRYNELHGCKYFDVGHKKIRFKNYVGVIQAGALTIEVLPKVDLSQQPDQQKWRDALVHMLHRAGFLKLESLSRASLRLRRENIFDLYVESFLRETNSLVHQGLIRRYRKQEGNLPYLKGKLLMSKHISENVLHKERFYTEHTLFDQDNIYNQILKSALAIVGQWPGNPHLAAEARSLSINFEDVSEGRFSLADFARMRFDRNTDRYRTAIQLAKLIILEFLPDIKAGREHVLAILFDMNMLFERYVFSEMKRAEKQFSDSQLHLSSQRSRRFWGRQSLRPDIIADFVVDGEKRRIVLDTKWKSLKAPEPADEDLRQMYAYNLQFGAQRAVLIYPRAACKSGVYDDFRAGEALEGYDHGCGLEFVEIFNQENRLKPDLGRELIEQIVVVH